MTMKNKTTTNMPLTVLFDGDCALCNKFVVFVLKRDKGKKFHFQSLQSDYGQTILKLHQLPNSHFETVVLVKENQVMEKSNAVLEILKQLGYPWKLCYFFKIVPLALRNHIYDFVARNRHRWVKQATVCALPKSDWKGRY
tara:strand:+ start:1426 stop:1845 length:420 start_codon:yes stop_codon:yes gene_type:complete